LSSAPSFLYRNRCGVYCFQRRVPEHFRQGASPLPAFIRTSLSTKNRILALAKARKLSVMFDELAQQYFNSPEDFWAAVKLLQRYKDAVAQFPQFADFQANFLDHLDDVTGHDSLLLDHAVDYEKAKQIISGSTAPAPVTNAAVILDARSKTNTKPISNL